MFTVTFCVLSRDFRFSQGVYEVSFPLGYETTFLMFRTNQWSGNVRRRFCTEAAASRSRRTEHFYISLKVAKFGDQ